jgi:hypothetical protein
VPRPARFVSRSSGLGRGDATARLVDLLDEALVHLDVGVEAARAHGHAEAASEKGCHREVLERNGEENVEVLREDVDNGGRGGRDKREHVEAHERTHAAEGSGGRQHRELLDVGRRVIVHDDKLQAGEPARAREHVAGHSEWGMGKEARASL